MSIIETMIDIPMEHERNVCGQFDAYLKKIERTLHVTMITRDGALKIIGPEQTIRQAKSVFNNLLELSKRGNTVTEQNVDYALSLSFTEKDDQILEIDKDIICPDDHGQAGQTEDDGTETVCGPDPQEDDCIWHRSGGYRKNVSGDVDGDTGI
mgnify:CR=1 FL=1